jgi:hypothetical protein
LKVEPQAKKVVRAISDYVIGSRTHALVYIKRRAYRTGLVPYPLANKRTSSSRRNKDDFDAEYLLTNWLNLEVVVLKRDDISSNKTATRFDTYLSYKLCNEMRRRTLALEMMEELRETRE